MELPVCLNEKWRVDRIDTPSQWTLEKRKTVNGVERWTAYSFCQTRHGLQTAIREKVIRGASFYPGSENLAVTSEILARIGDFPLLIGEASQERID